MSHDTMEPKDYYTFALVVLESCPYSDKAVETLKEAQFDFTIIDTVARSDAKLQEYYNTRFGHPSYPIVLLEERQNLQTKFYLVGGLQDLQNLVSGDLAKPSE